jgi:uncharacterized protein YutE (UPF0331/DUF86 family)
MKNGLSFNRKNYSYWQKRTIIYEDISIRRVIMYNQKFLDTMDKINSIAKTIGYQNGITWARKQLENGIINECTFGSFSNCHDLRNLMAHGASMDINISAETMQKAQLFLNNISQPYTSNNSNTIIRNTSLNKIQANSQLEVQVGDFVIIMYKNKVNILSYSNYKTSIEVGTFFKVIEITDKNIILENLNNSLIYDYNSLFCAHNFNFDDGLYVFKTNVIGFTPNNNRPVYVLGRPELNKNIKDTPFIHFEFSTDSPYTSNFCQPCRYADLEVRKVSAKGYLAHIDCFDKSKSKKLLDFTKNDEDEYLEKTSSSYTLRNNDDEEDLPF